MTETPSRLKKNPIEQDAAQWGCYRGQYCKTETLKKSCKDPRQ